MNSKLNSHSPDVH